MGEDDGVLEGEEGGVRVGLREGGRAAPERGDDRRGAFGGDVGVERAGGIGLHERTGAAELQAADPADLDVVVQAGFGDGFFEAFLDAVGVGRAAAGGQAATQDDFFLRGEFALLDLLEVGEGHEATHFRICSTAVSGVWRGVTVPS